MSAVGTWGTCLYQGPLGECFGVPRLRSNWSIRTKKSGVLASFSRVLSKGSTKGRPWEAGQRTLISRAIGESYKELTYTCDSAGCYPGHVLGRGGGRVTTVSSTPSRLLGHTKWMPRQQYYRAVQLNSQQSGKTNLSRMEKQETKPVQSFFPSPLV